MAEQENIKPQGEINAHVASRLATLEKQLADTEEALEALNKAADHLATLLQAQYDWKNRVETLEKQVVELENQVETLEKQVEKLEDQGIDHYHDEYANIDHVERSESSFNSQLYQIKNDISNLEYRCSDVERKAERAQSTADNAARNARGGW